MLYDFKCFVIVVLFVCSFSGHYNDAAVCSYVAATRGDYLNQLVTDQLFVISPRPTAYMISDVTPKCVLSYTCQCQLQPENKQIDFCKF